MVNLPSLSVIEKILERDPAEEMTKAFALFDEDATGKISLKNLKKVARDIDEDVDEEELLDMIKEFDTDGDGQINQEVRIGHTLNGMRTYSMYACLPSAHARTQTMRMSISELLATFVSTRNECTQY